MQDKPINSGCFCFCFGLSGNTSPNKNLNRFWGSLSTWVGFHRDGGVCVKFHQEASKPTTEGGAAADPPVCHQVTSEVTSEVTWLSTASGSSKEGGVHVWWLHIYWESNGHKSRDIRHRDTALGPMQSHLVGSQFGHNF